MEHLISLFKEGNGITGNIRIVTTRAGTDEILRTSPWYSNLVMLGTDTGKGLILQRLNADNTYSLNITHAEIGTGTTAPIISDTGLETPVARTPKVTGEISGDTLTLQFFIADIDLPNDTYYEFGTFIDGNATIGTGKIYNRALFGLPYTKGSSEDTTIQLNITVT